MKKMIYVVPGKLPDGTTLRVKRPETLAVLPPSGDWWPLDTYTIRRLRDGDVLETEAPPAFKEPDSPAIALDGPILVETIEPKETKSKKKRADAPKED